MDWDRFQQAISLRDSGRLEESVRVLAAVAQAASEPADKAMVLLNESTCLALMGRTREARKRLEEADSLLPATSEFRPQVDFTDACVSIAENQPRDALRKLDRLLKDYSALLQPPDHRDLYGETLARRGMLLVELNRAKEARPILEEALSLDSERSADFYYELGVCYFDLKEFQTSREAFSKALEMGPGDYRGVRAHYYLGLINIQMGAFARAKQEFEICLGALDKSDVPRAKVYRGLATACEGLGLDDEAQRYAKLAKTE